MNRGILLLLLCCSVIVGQARERLSYLYIQGDKQTPFYVKLEDEMQPRYGKNYSIIPQLAPGVAHIEILFQQNAFPAQKFTVLIPDGGSRGFLLVKNTDDYALYDLQQGFYLNAGNTEADDRLPIAPTGAVVHAEKANVVSIDTSKDKTPKPLTKFSLPKIKTTKTRTKAVIEQEKPKTTEGPVFIQNVELPGNKENSESSNPGNSNRATTDSSLPTIINSDCPTAISSSEFGKIFNAMSAYSAEEERIEYLQGKMDVCYESWQARALAQMLTGDAARFSLLKKIYPRITDQGAFGLLDDLLTTEIWKAEFARLVRR